MSNFAKNWEAPERKGSAPSGPLKPHIESTIKLIGTQVQRLDIANNRLVEKDAQIFNKVVDAYAKHDKTKATIYANELVEIRKIIKRVTQVKLALESISLRLNRKGLWRLRRCNSGHLHHQGRAGRRAPSHP